MALNVRFRPQVVADIEAASDWYAERAPGLDSAFWRAVMQVVTQAVEMPAMYPEVDPPVRRALLRGFPYAVFFVASPDELVVLACLHERRSPDRWPLG